MSQYVIYFRPAMPNQVLILCLSVSVRLCAQSVRMIFSPLSQVNHHVLDVSNVSVIKTSNTKKTGRRSDLLLNSGCHGINLVPIACDRFDCAHAFKPADGF